MKKITLNELSAVMYDVKTVIVNICTHDKKTGVENWSEITTGKWLNDLDYETTKTAEVMMFKALKKDTIKIWCIKYI